MADAPQTPEVEILDKLPESFSNAATVNTILQLQGKVTAGFSKSGAAGFKELNFPNYAGDLGGKYCDTGGQTASTAEKLHFEALHGQPTIMFAMQNFNNPSDTPMIVRHNNPSQGDAVIVYLPWQDKNGRNIINECKIAPDSNGLVSKEATMAHRGEIYPFIAVQALEFLQNNIANFENKNVIIDGNYADGLQTSLDIKSQLKSQNHEGEVVAIGTFHTHGINKFVDNAVKILGSEHQFVQQLRILQKDGVKLADIPQIEAGIKAAGLEAINKEYSFTDRLSIEATDNVAQFDAIMAVDNAMHDKLANWLETAQHGTNEAGKTNVGFAINGFNANVFNPEVLGEKSTIEINNLVRPLLEKAYNTGTKPEISDEQLAGTNFITACRPESRKNSDGAIKAFVQWAEQNPNDKGNLILIGHSPENGLPSNDQQKIIALIDKIAEQSPDIAKRILLLPSLRSDEIRTILQLEKAVGVAASTSEPWGIGAIEIMASGVPLVASDLYAAATHVVQHFAKSADLEENNKSSIELFQSPSQAGATRESSQESFVEAMEQISGNYDIYKQRSLNLAPDIAANFQWEAMVNEYEKLENRILNQKITPAVPANTMVLQDVDGCLTPNINEEGRRPHSEMNLLQGQLRLLQEQGGVSVISTGRSLAGVEGDELLKSHPIDYVISSVGCQVAMRDENDKLVNSTEFENWLLTPPEGKGAFDKQTISNIINSDTEIALDIQQQPSEAVAGHRCGFIVKAQPHVDAQYIINELQQTLGNETDYKILPSFDPHSNNWNVDIMPERGGKENAASWLIENLNAQRQTHEQPALENAIICGDSGNDIPAMNPNIYGEMKVAVVAPANATNEMREYLALQSANDNGNMAVNIPSEYADFNAPTGGVGGVGDGIKNAIHQFTNGKKHEVPATGINGGSATHIVPNNKVLVNSLAV